MGRRRGKKVRPHLPHGVSCDLKWSHPAGSQPPLPLLPDDATAHVLLLSALLLFLTQSGDFFIMPDTASAFVVCSACCECKFELEAVKMQRAFLLHSY